MEDTYFFLLYVRYYLAYRYLDIYITWFLPWRILILLLLLFSSQVVLDSLQPMDYSTLGFPILHYLPEFGQIHVHWISDAI